MASVRMMDEEDHVKTSICPGMSTTKMLVSLLLLAITCSMPVMMCSGWAVKRLRAVRMAPFGPSLWSFITLLN